MSEKIELNTDILADASGKVTERSLAEKLPVFDPSPFRGRHVLLRGCAPTWAVLPLQHKLEGVASHLSFEISDGKEIPIW